MVNVYAAAAAATTVATHTDRGKIRAYLKDSNLNRNHSADFVLGSCIVLFAKSHDVDTLQLGKRTSLFHGQAGDFNL